MATPYEISVSAPDTGLLAVEQDEAAAARVSELLQKDLEVGAASSAEAHRVVADVCPLRRAITSSSTTRASTTTYRTLPLLPRARPDTGQISHQLLALYGTGAAPSVLQEAYDANTSYQIKADQPTRGLAVVDELEADWAAHAPRYLGQGRHYADFLRYFQRQMERADGGWEAVIKDHVLADGPAALDMRGRLCAGFLHPLIQLMYGIEWRQPAMVAEGLAQAAVHDSRIGDFLVKVDRAAASASAPQQHRPLIETLEGIRAEHPKLAASARWSDANRLHDGVLTRAEPEAVALLAGIRVRPGDLAERTAEMVHCAAYVAAAAAWNPPHVPKFDFFLMCVPDSWFPELEPAPPGVCVHAADALPP